MELLPCELERALKRFAKFEKDPETAWSRTLNEMGDIDLFGLESHGMVFHDQRGYHRTVEGRSYFQDRRRDTRHRWAPVIAAAVIGVCGTLLGVAVTLTLG